MLGHWVPSVEHEVPWDHWAPLVGHWIPLVEHWVPLMGHWVPWVEHWVPLVGHWAPWVAAIQEEGVPRVLRKEGEEGEGY